MAVLMTFSAFVALADETSYSEYFYFNTLLHDDEFLDYLEYRTFKRPVELGDYQQFLPKCDRYCL